MQQHSDSLRLVSQREYQQVKALTEALEKARDLLDLVIHKGAAAAEELLQFLIVNELQETFPKLPFLYSS